MIRVGRYLPCALLLVASIAWGKYSVAPRLERLEQARKSVVEHEKVLETWAWVEGEPVPGEIDTIVEHSRRLSVNEVAAQVSSTRVSLARLAEASDGTAQFEIKSDFEGLLHFLERITGSSCQFLGVWKNGGAGLRTSFRMEAS